MTKQPFLFAPAIAIWQHRELIRQLVRRDIEARYRGSVAGILWALLNPVLTLIVFSLFFNIVAGARFDQNLGGAPNFTLFLFPGLIFFWFLSDIATRTPGLIASYASYVKRVVFPLDILPFVVLCTALFHALIGFGLLLLVLTLGYGMYQPKILLLLVIMFPFLLFCMGLSWFLASLGVFFRDLGQLVGPLVTFLMFLSPVMYPLSNLAPQWQPLLYFNPLTLVVEQARLLVFANSWPNLEILGVITIISWLFMVMGYLWFKRSQPAFADVI
ncbi:ABC transporter permease [Ferrovibrio sp.]|uniref:ABC transporter permease n=1 Tax=Ferrovibrio sp. TaxID=1917215 RepID=UPI003D0DD10F